MAEEEVLPVKPKTKRVRFTRPDLELPFKKKKHTNSPH